jgi:hypothetical protein
MSGAWDLPSAGVFAGGRNVAKHERKQSNCMHSAGVSFFPFQDSAKSSTRRLRKKVSTRAFCAEFGAARGGRGEKKGCPHPNVHFGCDIIMTEPVPMLLTLNWGGSSTHGIGDDVQFVGLQSRGDLNGKNGQVISWIESRWRYGVRVNGTGEEIAAKPENIVSSQAT